MTDRTEQEQPRVHTCKTVPDPVLLLCGLVAAHIVCQAHGRTLHVSPDSLDAVPEEQQFRSIAVAAKQVRSGDRVLIHSGVYRESVNIHESGREQEPILFEPAPGADVVVTGADRLQAWKEDPAAAQGDNIYVTSLSRQLRSSNGTITHPDDDYHRLIGRAEQVFVEGYALKQVLSRGQLSRGTFFVDAVQKRLYVWSSNNQKVDDEVRVEVSVRPVVWECRGDCVRVRGLRFRYAANHAQRAAVRLHGRGNVVEDCIFERMNSIGAGFIGPDQVARRCTFQDNGQMGWGAREAHRLVVTECLTRNNNLKGFDRDWEAGGNKIVLTRGAIIEKSRFVENRGHGLWFDIGNESITVRNCLIARNEDAGIFYEISLGLHAHDNVIVGNGLESGFYAWGASAGIAISSSPGCVIERNLLVGNKEGIALREQNRETPRIDRREPEEPIWNHDEIIQLNLIAYNRDAQVWGWFDVGDERHWPEAAQKGTPSAKLSLETLKLTFDRNVYAMTGRQELFHWGVPWERHVSIPNLAALRRELGLEPAGTAEDVAFENVWARDFRVPPGSAALRLGAYPQGDVPEVLLGAAPGLDRSAASARE